MISKNDFGKIEKKNNICINVFCYQNGLFYPVHISDEKFKNCMDLLMITNKDKSHYVYIKHFTDLCVIRQSVKVNNTFVDIVYNALVVKEFS